METLLVLALLACPVGMGAMMWFMSRGMNKMSDESTPPREGEPPATVAELRARQARLEVELERLEEKGRNGGHAARV